MRSSILCITLFAALSWQNAMAVDFSGRFSMLSATAQAKEDDWGYQSGSSNILTADQQGVRLMLDESDDVGEWSAHLRTVRTHTDVFTAASSHSSALFRYSDLGDTALDESDGSTSTVIRYELDRLYYRHHIDNSIR